MIHPNKNIKKELDDLAEEIIAKVRRLDPYGEQEEAMARGGARAMSGPPKGYTGKKKGNKKKGEVADHILDDLKEEVERTGEEMTPLAYMLKVMNTDGVEDTRRDRMAMAAAPFVHVRPGDKKGKKEEKHDKAKKAGNKFAPSKAPAPLKAVK